MLESDLSLLFVILSKFQIDSNKQMYLHSERVRAKFIYFRRITQE